MATTTPAQLIWHKGSNIIYCKGNWSILNLNKINTYFKGIKLKKEKEVIIDGSFLTHLDSAGALVLSAGIKKITKRNKNLQLIHFSNEQQSLLALIEKKMLKDCPYQPTKTNFFYYLGKEVFAKITQAQGFINLLGDLSIKLFHALKNWHRFRIKNIIANIDAAGIKALPIVGLLSFLIGIVLAYQMGLQLQTYGANTFIAYLSGMAIFREFAPLITAIIVAGRTSSAFTAQIGNMKINEEIDALKTMGLSPTTLLVLPKVTALLLVFPLLIFWADVFSILGAMLMSKWMLQLSHLEFLSRLQESVGWDQMRLGLYKAPAFAFLIAMVGCFQGFNVQASADNIGSQTTKSVVQALFLIIITDAIYSIVYSWLDL